MAIAEAVVKAARDEGIGKAIPDDSIPAAVRSRMWDPHHPAVVPV
jgi:hypothetical protein